ncbi:hypothetical protein C7M84_018856 [Penaeus vannamei]|uniref:Uncharacterized protein n=1 Tax=Penaeus vannamei TaxID=6689 RepID=A0A423SGG5_PENVA|nr:hypothetical protein C7M84_018856 [Penaeus vannamei]
MYESAHIERISISEDYFLIPLHLFLHSVPFPPLLLLLPSPPSPPSSPVPPRLPPLPPLLRALPSLPPSPPELDNAQVLAGDRTQVHFSAILVRRERSEINGLLSRVASPPLPLLRIISLSRISLSSSPPFNLPPLLFPGVPAPRPGGSAARVAWRGQGLEYNIRFRSLIQADFWFSGGAVPARDSRPERGLAHTPEALMRPCAHQRPAADAGQRQARFCLITPGRSFGFRRRRVFQGRWTSGGGRALFSLRPFAPSVSVSPPSCDGRGVRAPRGARGLGRARPGFLAGGTRSQEGGRLSPEDEGRLPLARGSCPERDFLWELLRLSLVWEEGNFLWKEGLCGPKGGFSGAKGGLYEGTKGGREGFYRSGLFLEQKEAFRLNESLLSTKEAFLSIRYRGGRGGGERESAREQDEPQGACGLIMKTLLSFL